MDDLHSGAFPMCGRYSLFATPEEVSQIFRLPLDEVERVFELRPRYNIAPTDTILSIRTSTSGGREAAAHHWGLIPRWAERGDFGARTINARAETVASRPAFRDSFRLRRCLIPANGFYEWRKLPARKQPYYFRLRTGGTFAFAGLWDRWESGEQQALESCTIITTRPNSVTRPIHDRMPVILSPDAYDKWLDPECSDQSDLRDLLVPYPDDEMVGYPVSSAVSRPGKEGPELVEPIELLADESLELDLG